jgi:hypothetical protein
MPKKKIYDVFYFIHQALVPSLLFLIFSSLRSLKKPGKKKKKGLVMKRDCNLCDETHHLWIFDQKTSIPQGTQPQSTTRVSGFEI